MIKNRSRKSRGTVPLKGNAQRRENYPRILNCFIIHTIHNAVHISCSRRILSFTYCTFLNLSISIFPHLSPTPPLSISIYLPIFISHAISIILSISISLRMAAMQPTKIWKEHRSLRCALPIG
jgi:hypothetical protein